MAVPKVPLVRVVIFLSPVFVGLAGWIVTLAAEYLPGHPHLNSGELTLLFIAGSFYAASHVGLWVHHWCKRAHAPPAGGVVAH